MVTRGICLALLLTGAAVAAPGQSVVSLPPVLRQAQEAIQLTLRRMDRDLDRAAEELQRTGLAGKDAREVLGELVRAHPGVIAVRTIDLSGRIVTAESEAHRHTEGSDVAGQEHVVRLLRTRGPVLSRAFLSVEGFDGVDLQHPVTAANGKLLGAVSLLVQPKRFLERIVGPNIEGLPLDAWIMQTDGRILYDPDPEELGRNLFSDPVYRTVPGLVDAGRKIAASDTGAAVLSLPGKDGKPRKSQAYWTTAGLHGTEWRVISVQPLPGDPAPARRSFSELQLRHADEALRKLAADPDLVRTLERDGFDPGLPALKAYYQAYPGLYSIQWTDADGVNHGGYPAENSLDDYDFRQDRHPTDRQFLSAVRKAREQELTLPLFEGHTGRFFLVPVRSSERFLGVLYTIRLDPQSAHPGRVSPGRVSPGRVSPGKDGKP